jgi:hypothetical protein
MMMMMDHRLSTEVPLDLPQGAEKGLDHDGPHRPTTISGESKFWREDIIRKEMKNVDPDSDDLYAKWLIPKFFKIIKDSRLIPERIEKLIVKFITS